MIFWAALFCRMSAEVSSDSVFSSESGQNICILDGCIVDSVEQGDTSVVEDVLLLLSDFLEVSSKTDSSDLGDDDDWCALREDDDVISSEQEDSEDEEGVIPEQDGVDDVEVAGDGRAVS